MKPSIPFSCKEGPGHVVPCPPAILHLIWGHMVDKALMLSVLMSCFFVSKDVLTDYPYEEK